LLVWLEAVVLTEIVGLSIALACAILGGAVWVLAAAVRWIANAAAQ